MLIAGKVDCAMFSGLFLSVSAHVCVGEWVGNGQQQASALRVLVFDCLCVCVCVCVHGQVCVVVHASASLRA